jgi:hypothetical protein
VKGHLKVEKANQEGQKLKLEDRRSNLEEDGKRTREDERGGRRGLFILEGWKMESSANLEGKQATTARS